MNINIVMCAGKISCELSSYSSGTPCCNLQVGAENRKKKSHEVREN